MEERIQKILSNLGVCARRRAEQLIKAKKVTINGVVAELGQKADPELDFILVSGKRIRPQRKIYLMFNKPAGYICSLKDEGYKKSIMKFIKIPDRVYPVGRLDFDTEGLLFLTNDGDFANHIMHPRYNVEKTYVVRVDKDFRPDYFKQLEKGVFVEDHTATAKGRYLVDEDPRVIELTIHEGKKHIVKNLMKILGYKVEYLARVRIGKVYLGELRKGKYRNLNNKELELLRRVSVGH